jgi:hypothetical protein
MLKQVLSEPDDPGMLATGADDLPNPAGASAAG